MRMRLVGLVVALGVLGTVCGFNLSSKNDTHFLFLGGDAMMRVRMPSKEYDVLRLERDAVGKCHPFPSAPIASGELGWVEGSTLTYIGNQDILSVDFATHKYVVSQCELSTSLSCKEIARGESDIFSATDMELTFIEPNMLMMYDSLKGAYKVFEIVRGSGCSTDPTDCIDFTSSPAATGNLQDLCQEQDKVSWVERFSVSSFGPRSFFAACKGYDNFVVASLTATMAEGTAFTVDSAQHGAVEHAVAIEYLGGNLVLGYNPATQDFRVSTCDASKCHSTKKRSLATVSSCSIHATKEACLADSKCGFCVDNGQCSESWGASKCYGYCNMWVSSGSNTTTPEFQDSTQEISEKQIVFLSNNLVLRFVPESGEYQVFTVVDDMSIHRAKCPGVSQEPLYSGVLPFQFHTATYFKEREVLFHNAKTGHVALWVCNTFATQRQISTEAPCMTTFSAMWPQSIGATRIVNMRNYTLLYNEDSGVLDVFSNYRDKWDGTEGMAGTSMFSNASLATYNMPELKGHGLVRVEYPYMLEYSPQQASYRFWVFNARRLSLEGPGGRGSFLAKHTQFSWLGEDRLMAFQDNVQYYQIVRFVESGMASDGAIAFTTVSRGSFENPKCAYESCNECTSDPECGWCSSSGKCLPGVQSESCNQGSAKRCSSWLFDYCAASSCTSRLLKQDCLTDQVCGWCETTAMCLRAKEAKPIEGSCPGNFTVSLI